MNCRNCNNELLTEAIVCIKCGYDPMSESNFCHNCGTETSEKQVVCIKCGIGLSNKISKSTSKSMKSRSSIEYDGFYRSSDEKILLGVCGGLAHKFDIQLGLVRVLVFFSGFFFIGFLYFGGFFIPKLPTKGI
jgi:phage shock protein PspC (stress-responsive transcriptional regulator)